MLTKRCNCGTKYLENIDVTHAKSASHIFFTRCSKCGLVIDTHGYSAETENQTLLQTIAKKLICLKSVLLHNFKF